MEKNVKSPDKSDPVLQFYKYNKLKECPNKKSIFTENPSLKKLQVVKRFTGFKLTVLQQTRNALSKIRPTHCITSFPF